MEEIVHDEPRPQSIRILQKHGDKIVIVEEEDTTKEFRRLETTLTGVMKQIKVSTTSGKVLVVFLELDNDTVIVCLQEITRVAEQRRQLIK